MPEKCHVIGCNHPMTAKGLCQKHYMRVKRNGNVDQVRPNDWGQRNKHPAYKAWSGLRRYHLNNMSDEWKNDFWQFAKDVGDRPQNAKAHRPDNNSIWSKENFYWKEQKISSKDRLEYMRKWQQQRRKVNREYYKNHELKKLYGVSYEWYLETLSKQNGVCAICFQPETAVIRDKLLSLAVDHCHDTGKVRGLLCRSCNNSIGAFKHDPKILQSAIKYLQT